MSSICVRSTLCEAYLSSCVGRIYPSDRILSDRMLGSMMASSVSGVLRIRPEDRGKIQPQNIDSGIIKLRCNQQNCNFIYHVSCPSIRRY